MTKNQLLDALSALLPPQLEALIYKLGVPASYLPGPAAAPGTRIPEILRWAEQQRRLADVARLLAEVTAPAPPLATPAPTPTAPVIAGKPKVSIDRLPPTTAQLFGREAEGAWLDRCWAAGAHVASIVAFGGVGKSALVWDWLMRMQDDGWRGAERVYGWSFYSQGTTERMTSADEFISAALTWFGDDDPTQGSPWDKGERLAERVRARRTLLVLDGLEPHQRAPGPEEGQLKDPSLQALVRSLGRESTGLCVITTRLAVRDLERYGEEKRPKLRLDHLTSENGARLLKARRVRGSDAELMEASQEYEGHCLALTLLGSYLEEVCEGDVLGRHRIGVLEHDERQGHEARRVMAAYERWFKQGPELTILKMMGFFDRPADEGEIAALRKLPVIPGLTNGLYAETEEGEPPSLAQAFIGTTAPRPLTELKWNRAIAKLRRVGLLAEDLGEKRPTRKLDAHPLVREHFGEQVRRKLPDAWREGHSRLYEYLKNSAKEFPETVEEMGPLYAAVTHGCLAERYQEAQYDIYFKRIQRSEKHFSLRKLGTYGSTVAALSAFFDPPWENLTSRLRELSRGYIMNEAGFALQALGRLHEAAALIQMSMNGRISQQDWKNASRAASNLGELFFAFGELGDALSYFRNSVTLADKSGDAGLRMFAGTRPAVALHAMGHWAEAATQFERAERAQKALQPPHPLLYALQGFQYCDLLLDQGKFDEVLARAAQTLGWIEKTPWVLNIALDHLSLGRAHLLLAQRGTSHNLAEATTHLKEAVEGLRRAGMQEYVPLGLLARADLHTHAGAFDLARKDLDEALDLAERCGFRLHETDAHLDYTRLHIAEGNAAEARVHVVKARVIIDKTGYHRRDEELVRLEGACQSTQAGGAGP